MKTDQTIRRRLPMIAVAIVFGVAGPLPVMAQSLQQRITDYRQRNKQSVQSEADQQKAQLQSVRRKMTRSIGPVQFDNTPARSALEWWSKATGVSVLINWNAMQLEGIEEDTPIRLRLSSRVPADVLLQIILAQMVPPELRMVFEPTPWYVRVMTRTKALQQPVTRVYDLADLIMNVPDFRNAPKLSLESALSKSSTSSTSGSSSGTSGSSTGIFGDDDDDDDDDDNNSDDSSDNDRASRPRSKAARAEQIAQLIRDTIESDIWVENGGQYGTIRYFQGRLIVNAAPFVQRQIGAPVGNTSMHSRYNAGSSNNAAYRSRSGGAGGAARGSAGGTGGSGGTGGASGVSGVQGGRGSSVSGVQK